MGSIRPGPMSERQGSSNNRHDLHGPIAFTDRRQHCRTSVSRPGCVVDPGKDRQASTFDRSYQAIERGIEAKRTPMFDHHALLGGGVTFCRLRDVTLQEVAHEAGDLGMMGLQREGASDGHVALTMSARPRPVKDRQSMSTRPTVLDVLVFPQFSMMSLAATIEPMRAANRVAGQELYRWRLLSPDGASPVSSSGITIAVAGAFAPDVVGSGLFVVAAFDARAIGRGLASGLRTVARRGVSLAGIESGAWVLGRAGLLDGHRATTHWEDLDDFAATFPKVEVLSDRFVMDRARWTAGGAAPALDMMLAMISEEHGLPLALNVASIFIYEQAQAPSAPQPIVSIGRTQVIDPAIAKVMNFMQRHLDEPVPMPELAAKAGLQIRTMQARFRAQLGTSPHNYYLDLRLAAAKRMLQHSGHTIAEVATAHGFGSASAFARAFRARFGLSPVESRARGGGSWAVRPARP